MDACCAIVLTGTRYQLDHVFVCCEVSVKLVQRCEWTGGYLVSPHSQYGASFLSDDRPTAQAGATA